MHRPYGIIILDKEQKDRYKILSRKSCEKYCTQKHTKSAIIISIRSSWDRVLPDLTCTPENKVRAILSLDFDDIDIEDDPKFAMTDDDGRRVAEFVNKYYDQVDTIIAHCDGGISRSAGVIAAIMRVKEHDDSPVFYNMSKRPNRTCFAKTLKGFGYQF